MSLLAGRIPPTGNRIVRAEGSDPPGFPGYRVSWVNSGTASLALAMMAARSRANVRAPEVVLPAYGCPDLVSAAVYAGLTPVLADIGVDDPGYSLPALQRAIGANTVAVVAVNFLGIADRLSDIRVLLRQWPQISLIEDDAQWYPEPGVQLEGDYVCLSFGRGKPVTLLSGGALLHKCHEGDPTRPFDEDLNPGSERGSWELVLYNLVTTPLMYRAVSSIPGLDIGATRLRALNGILRFPPRRLSLLEPNARRYLSGRQDSAGRLSRLIAGSEHIVDLSRQLGGRSRRLLRFPVLLESQVSRDAMLSALHKVGIGASHLYEVPLAGISGVGRHVKASAAPGAERFSKRLLTLPVHDRVSQRHVDLMAGILTRDP